MFHFKSSNKISKLVRWPRWYQKSHPLFSNALLCSFQLQRNNLKQILLFFFAVHYWVGWLLKSNMPPPYLKTYFRTKCELICNKANVLNCRSSQWRQYNSIILQKIQIHTWDQEPAHLEEVDYNHEAFRIGVYTIASVSQPVRKKNLMFSTFKGFAL